MKKIKKIKNVKEFTAWKVQEKNEMFFLTLYFLVSESSLAGYTGGICVKRASSVVLKK